MNKKGFKAVTFTSSGYVDLTENLIQSINKNSVDIELFVYTLDDDSYAYFLNKDVKVENIKSEEVFSKELMKQSDSNFGELMMKKFYIIHKNLASGENVLYVDGDIVIKKDFTSYFIKLLEKYEIIFQNDKRPSKPNLINVCAGFMLIKSNKKMINFFDPQKIPKKVVNYKTHDQTYLNKSLNRFKYKILPLDSFPNGPFFYSNYPNIDPSIVHFNFIIGEDKIGKMKELNEWYI